MILLLYILECPEDAEAGTDAQLLKEFVRQVKKMQNEGDFQILNLLEGCLGLEQLATAATRQARNDRSFETGAEPSLDVFPDDTLRVGTTLRPS
jgi:hypothetical protein